MSLQVYDVLTGEVVKQLSGHRSLVRDVHWHPHQPMLLSASVSNLLGSRLELSLLTDLAVGRNCQDLELRCRKGFLAKSRRSE